jgi:very-short-patch-repair endonuclease
LSYILKNAKSLRSGQTDAETKLWVHLRAHRFFGLKFKRQKPIGTFIVDFVCLEQKLIIELDGSQHADKVDYDEQRTKYLENEGYKVLRFWNNQVLQEMESVLEAIRLEIALSPTPLPQAGEGL